MIPARSVSTAKKRREGPLECDSHRGVVHRLHGLDGLYLGAPYGVLLLVALQVELDGFRVERLAVVELDALAQLEGVRLAVVGDLVALGEHRHYLAVLVDVDEPVVDAGHHLPVHVGARQVGVELRRLGLEPDLERPRGRVGLRAPAPAAPACRNQ
jgi:hypothetical protein